MREFFKGWRRKVGYLTLVIACLSVAVWLRSGAFHDDIVQMRSPDTIFGAERQQSQAAARIALIRFDERRQSLFIVLRVSNLSDSPLYVVVSEFCFVDLGGAYSNVRIDGSGDGMTIDLSHAYPTQQGIRYYRGEEGSRGIEPRVYEIGPKQAVEYTYGFHFPLRLDPHVSNVPSVDTPVGTKRISVKIGFSSEKPDDFRRRELKSDDEIEDWQRKLTTQWQQTITTENEELVDFGRVNMQKDGGN